MRKFVLAAAAMALLIGTAMAQDAPPPPPPTGIGAPDAPDAPPPPPPGHGPRHDRGPGARDDAPPPPPPSKAAHIRLEQGDLNLDIKCADDEPMSVCADIAMKLLDKAAAAK